MEDPSFQMVVVRHHIKKADEALAKANPSEDELDAVMFHALSIAKHALEVVEWARMTRNTR